MLAFHTTFSTYGFWLPNDPRGSGSTYVGSKAIFAAAGKATKVHGKRSVASLPHDRGMRTAGRAALRRRPVVFTGLQARAGGQGFNHAVLKSGHRVFDCAVLPEHVHAVVAQSLFAPRRIVGHLKREATLRLRREEFHPFQSELVATGELPSCWGERARIVYLDTPEDVRRAIRYVEENPVKERKPRQRWSFVIPFEG